MCKKGSESGNDKTIHDRDDDGKREMNKKQTRNGEEVFGRGYLSKQKVSEQETQKT